MCGAFGLLGDPNPSHFPGDRIAERASRVDVFWLNRNGALVPDTVTELEWGPVGGPPASRAVEICRIGPGITIDGVRVGLSWDAPMEGVERPWWSCPLCSARCRFVYLRGGTIGCRKCLRLDYAVRHLRRQTPGVGRVERLRRKLGDCELRPFAPLPPRRRGRSQAYHDALVAMILDEEERLVAHLGSIVYDLNRRLRRRRGPRKRYDRAKATLRSDPASS
jgi:hypothetical protein